MIFTERDLYLTTASRASRELSPTRGPGTLRESHGGSIAGEFWNGTYPQKNGWDGGTTMTVRKT